ncbi:MAG: hypothetical protein OEM97_04335 [Acidimicrobiia bacterium]|nr:hypothetical protein [Acidimicrobiia bacterium]
MIRSKTASNITDAKATTTSVANCCTVTDIAIVVHPKDTYWAPIPIDPVTQPSAIHRIAAGFRDSECHQPAAVGIPACTTRATARPTVKSRTGVETLQTFADQIGDDHQHSAAARP